MPIGYAIDASRRIVFLRVWGILAGHIVEQLALTLRQMEGFEPEFSVLCDLREVTRFAIDHRKVAGYAAKSAFRREARRAVIVGSSESMGMTRMYEQVGRFEESLRIFHTRESALEWLGWPPGEPLPAESGVIGAHQVIG